jgi:hypothetical protein
MEQDGHHCKFENEGAEPIVRASTRIQLNLAECRELCPQEKQQQAAALQNESPFGFPG